MTRFQTLSGRHYYGPVEHQRFRCRFRPAHQLIGPAVVHHDSELEQLSCSGGTLRACHPVADKAQALNVELGEHTDRQRRGDVEALCEDPGLRRGTSSAGKAASGRGITVVCARCRAAASHPPPRIATASPAGRRRAPPCAGPAAPAAERAPPQLLCKSAVLGGHGNGHGCRQEQNVLCECPLVTTTLPEAGRSGLIAVTLRLDRAAGASLSLLLIDTAE